MIITSRMMIRNAQSGAEGNQTICAIALSETKKTAAQRAASLRANSPTPVRATSESRIRYTQPQVVALEMITPLPPMITFLSSRIAASPQSASSEPTINRTMPAKIAQSDGSLSRTDLDASISFLLCLRSVVGNAVEHDPTREQAKTQRGRVPAEIEWRAESSSGLRATQVNGQAAESSAASSSAS